MAFAFEDASRVAEDVERHLDDQDQGPDAWIMERLVDHARKLPEDDPVHDVDELSRIITAWTLDTSAEALTQGVELLRELGDRPCDPLTPLMLARRGINPYALLMIEASHMGTTLPKNVTLVTEDGQRAFLNLVPKNHARRGTPWDHASIALAPLAWWDGRSLEAPGLPATVLVASIGRHLRDVASHDELDPLDLRIADFRTDADGYAGLRTDREVAPTPWRDTIEAILADPTRKDRA